MGSPADVLAHGIIAGVVMVWAFDSTFAAAALPAAVAAFLIEVYWMVVHDE